MFRPRVLTRALEVAHAEGLRALWFRILAKTCYRRMIVVERLLDGPQEEVTAAMPVTIALLKMDDVDEYLRFRPSANASDVASRLASGDFCFAGWIDGRIANAMWITIGRCRVEYLDADIDVAPGDVYAYASFTAPEFRNRNLAATRGREIIRYLKERGYFRILGVILPENRPAFRPAEKLGYRRIGVIGRIKVGSFRHDFTRIDGASRPIEYPARSGGEASPVLQL